MDGKGPNRQPTEDHSQARNQATSDELIDPILLALSRPSAASQAPPATLSISQQPSQSLTLNPGVTNTQLVGQAQLQSVHLTAQQNAAQNPYMAAQQLGSQAPEQVVKTVEMQSPLFFHIPRFDYPMPPGEPLNFTMTEIIAILPHWFTNYSIGSRFVNNNITSSIHAAILEEHRDFSKHHVSKAAPLREYLGDIIRRVMRLRNDKWIKKTHVIPSDWDPASISMSNFIPDVAARRRWRNPTPVPFHVLAQGLRRLPEGPDAGDLTRALEFALNNPRPNWVGNRSELMFPDDLHAILDHIGRTHVTEAHTDRAVVARYTKKAQELTTLANLASKEALKETSEPPNPPANPPHPPPRHNTHHFPSYEGLWHSTVPQGGQHHQPFHLFPLGSNLSGAPIPSAQPPWRAPSPSQAHRGELPRDPDNGVETVSPNATMSAAECDALIAANQTLSLPDWYQDFLGFLAQANDQ